MRQQTEKTSRPVKWEIKRGLYLLFTLHFSLFIFSGCSKDGIEPDSPGGTPGQGGDIRFEIGFAPQGGSAQLQASGPQTRVATDEDFNSTWEDGDEIGIFAVESGQSLATSATGNHIHNVKLTYNSADGGSWSGEAWWPQDGTKLDFYAYYPYDDNGGNPQDLAPNAISFNVSTDQSVAADHSSSDLLFAKSDNGGSGYGKADGTVNLSFSHALAMVQVTLDNESGAIDGSEELFVELVDIKPGAELDLGGTSGPEISLPATDNDPTTITMYRMEQPGDDNYYSSYTFRALVPAQSVAQDAVLFRVTNGDVMLEGSKLTDDLVMKSGEAEKFTQNLPSVLPRMIQPEANSYMVAPYGQALLIPVSQANRVQGPDGLGAVTTDLGGVMKDNFTVDLVWADTPVGSDGVVREMDAVEYEDDGYVRVKPGIAGNAVVAIKDKDSGNIKWSWHIWVTEPVESGTDTETGLTWMDRNLGAKSNTPFINSVFDDDQWIKTLGLFYQWGRKDAFPGSNGSNGNQTYYTPQHSSGTTDNIPTDDHTELYTMVQKPLSFAKNYNNYYGSLNVPGDQNKSWNGNAGEKTLYDPCPPGWKVPPIRVDSKNVWGSNNASDWPDEWDKGRIFNGVNGNAGLGHYYPAAGWRAYSSGNFAVVTARGHWWSASHSASNAQSSATLGIYSGYVGPVSNNYRSYGMSVRCVAEY